MGSERKEYFLTDLYTVSSGLSKPAEDFGEGYPFVSFVDVMYNCFLPDELSQLVKSTESERRKCSVKRGDVFLTRTNLNVGLLLNFHEAKLTDGLHRIVNNYNGPKVSE